MKKFMSLVLILSLLMCSVAMAEVQGSDLLIAGLTPVENQWADMLSAGMKAACDEYGASFVVSNHNSDPVREVELINTYVTQGVSGIVSSPNEASSSIYEDASNQGVAIGFLNNPITEGLDNYTVAYYVYNNYDLGAAAGDAAVRYITENLNGNPVYHVIWLEKGTASDERAYGFIDKLTDAFGEDKKPVSESSTKEEATAMQQVSDALTANPDINIIFCCSENQYMGARAAIESLGLVGKVVCFAVDCSEAMCEDLLKDGDNILIGCGGQNSYDMGYQTTKETIEYLLGNRADHVAGTRELLKVPSLSIYDKEAVQEFYDMLKSFS